MKRNGIVTYEVENGLITFDTSSASIISADKSITKLVIPSDINGYPVRNINNDVFSGCSALEHVKMSEGLTSIGYRAFKNCKNLRKVEIPKTLNSNATVGYWFEGCSSLEEVVVEEGVTHIPRDAFANIPAKVIVKLPKSLVSLGAGAFANTAITAVLPYTENIDYREGVLYLPDVTSCEDYVFKGCVSLEKVIWPKSLPVMNNWMFQNCKSIKEVELPDTLTSLGYQAFTSCNSLEQVRIPKAVISSGNYYGSLGDWFSYCSSLKEIVVEEGTTSIVQGAFANIPTKVTIKLPGSVVSIGNNAFANTGITAILPLKEDVEDIEGVLYLPEITSCGNNVFEGCQRLEKVVWPKSLTMVKNWMFRNCYALKEVLLPDNLTLLGYQSFLNCKAMEYIKIPRTIDATGWHFSNGGEWFGGCSGLKEIILEEGMETIPDGAFANIPVKVMLKLPDSIVNVRNYAFANSALSTVASSASGTIPDVGVVVLPRNIAFLGDYLFDRCDSLEKVIWPGEYKAVTLGTFRNCTSLMEIDLPDEVEEIRNYAFQECKSIIKLPLPKELKLIGYQAFMNCKGLEYCIIPQKVNTTGWYFSSGGAWFSGCTSLKEIILEDGLETIPDGAFADIPGKIKMVLPESIQNIRSYAFANSGFTVVTSKESAVGPADGILVLPDTVKEMGDFLFDRCYNLEKVIWSKAYKIIPQGNFRSCTKLNDVTLPSEVEEIRNYAFQACSSLKGLGLPDNLNLIGYQAFLNCSSMERCVIPKSVNATGWYFNSGGAWFSGYTNLKEVILEEGMETIPDGALSDISAKVKLRIPESIKTIKNYAFANSGINTVVAKNSGVEATEGILVLPTTVEELGDYLFERCQDLEKVIWPIEYKVVTTGAFRSCTNLREVIWPDSVEEIRNYAFQDCQSIKDMVLPAKLKLVGYECFKNCVVLERIVIPEKVSMTGYYYSSAGRWFRGCSSLKEIVLEEGMERIPVGAMAEIPITTKVVMPQSIIEFENEAFMGSGITRVVPYDYEGEETAGILHLPASLEKIGSRVFKNCNLLTTVVWPKHLLQLPGEMFEGCSNLQEFVLPEGLVSVPDYMFEGCSNLKRIILPAGLTTIGYEAFKNCTSLEQMEIPNTVNMTGHYYSTGGRWFKGCTGLKELIFEEGIKLIPPGALSVLATDTKVILADSIEEFSTEAFADSGVTKIVPHNYEGPETRGMLRLPKNLSKIGTFAFRNCHSLTEVILTDTLLEHMPNFMFEGCSNLKRIVLPERLITIGYECFKNCIALEQISIPKTVSKTGYVYSSGGRWFKGCSNLKEIVLEEGMERIPAGAMAEIAATANVIMPQSITAFENEAFMGSGITIVVPYGYEGGVAAGMLRLPANLKEVGSRVFKNCNLLTNVIWPELLLDLPDEMFEGCCNLQEFILPEGLERVPDYMFEGCGNLKSIILPDSLTTIGYEAFKNCTSLERMKIPKAVCMTGYYYSSGGRWFRGCTGLKEIAFEDGVKLIPPGALASLSMQSKVILADSVEELGNEAFAESGITSVVPYDYEGPEITGMLRLPKNFTKIGTAVFRNCRMLNEVILPETILDIHNEAFKGCTELKKMKLPAKLKTLPNYMFEGCSSLYGIELPDDLAMIGYNCFKNCTGLLQITIPKQVSTTGYYYSSGGRWFSGCSELKAITWADGAENVPAGALSELPSDVKINLPDSITEFGPEAFMSAGITAVVPSNYDGEVTKGMLRLPKGMTKFGSRAFNNCGLLQRVILPNEEQELTEEMFSNCSVLTDVILPANLKILPNYMFKSCASLKQIDLPKSLTTIGYEAFCNCPSLEGILIPEHVSEAGRHYSSYGRWFKGCTNLMQIVLEEGMEQIPSGAFAEILSDYEIMIPDSVVSIGDMAFYNCVSLSKIQLTTGIEYTGKDIFQGCDQLQVSFPMNYHLINHIIDNKLKYVVIEGEEFVSHGIVNPEQSYYQKSTNQIVANGYATCIVQYNVDELEFNKIREPKVRVRIPKSTRLYENSVVLNDQKISNYTFSDQWIVVPVSESSGIMQFTVQQTAYDKFISFASLNYTKDRQKYDDLIGYLYTEVPPLSVNAPSITGHSTFNIMGVSAPESDVVILLDGKAAGITKANKSGNYTISVTLENSRGGVYSVEVQSLVENGSMYTVSAMIEYYPLWPEILDFNMYYRRGSTAYSVDLMQTINQKMIVDHNYSYPFSYMVRLSEDSMVSKLYICSTKDGVKKTIEASRDGSTGNWTAGTFFDEKNHNYIPGKISIEFTPDWDAAAPSVLRLMKAVGSQFDMNAIDLSNLLGLKPSEQGYLYQKLDDLWGDSQLTDSAVLGRGGKNIAKLITDVRTYLNLHQEINDSNMPNDESTKVYDENIKDLLFDGIESMACPDSMMFGAEVQCYIDENDRLVRIRNYAVEDFQIQLAMNTRLNATGLFDQTSMAHMILMENINVLKMYSNTNIETQVHELAVAIVIANRLRAAGNYDDYFIQLQKIADILWALEQFLEKLKEGVAALKLLLKVINGNLPNSQTGPEFGDNFKYPVDPQGFVYEAVTSNRLANVTASVFYQDEVTGKAKLWNASEYGQKNNQMTDTNGVFAWDVPSGLWQVRCTLEDYEPAQSNWLPVPPPQLDVKIPMVSDAVPKIIAATHEENCINLEFDIYMEPESVANIKVTDNTGKNISYMLEFCSAETNHNNIVYAKAYSLRCTDLSDTYWVEGGPGILSYAGVGMADERVNVN